MSAAIHKYLAASISNKKEAKKKQKKEIKKEAKQKQAAGLEGDKEITDSLFPRKGRPED